VAKHDRPARTSKGWRTAVSYDGAGYPDLTLCHPSGRLLFLEVKVWARRNTVTDRQLQWLDLFGRVPGVTARLVTERDWDDIRDLLDVRSVAA
jgi:hypothetical protein